MSSDIFEIRERLRKHYGRDAEVALEQTANRTSQALDEAVRARWPRLGDNGPWTWVADYHDDWAIVMVETDAEIKHYRVGYTWDDGKIVLDQEMVEVVRRDVWEKAHDARLPGAFLTEVNGKVVVTAPVSSLRETAGANPLFLHVNGRFVGAEKANRNGALWTTADLEIGRPTVKHGPLNWLHEERHIIGTLVEDEMFAGQREAAQIAEPYIGVESVIWKWLYPQEAATVEMAAEQGKAWYSMECISERVHCTDPSCQGDYGYFEVLRASEGVCDHVKLKQVARRFENPTFLGGAIIVPPVRPGWADANIEVMREAASLAEGSWEAAGLKDSQMDATEWELLMAQIVRFSS